MGPSYQVEESLFARNKEAFPCVRPWTQLSASPRTVHVRWKSFLDHVDHVTPRAPGRWTTARSQTAISRRWEDAGVESQTERCTRVNWFLCGVVRQSVEKNRRCGGVEDGLANGGNSRGR